MLIDRRSIDTHAERRLGDGSGTDREERLQAFKGFLKIETERLRIRHRFGLGGVDIAAGRAYLVDLVLKRICELAALESGRPLKDREDSFAALALGGYGRRELAPFSDVDVLFLHDGKSAGETKALVEHALLMLWDAGLTVGHSFRSIPECVAMVRGDLHSRNAMAESRLLTGSERLVNRLSDELMRGVYSSRRITTTYLEQMQRDGEQRRARFGNVACVLEPNVKETAGGLRDLHTVFWVGHARFGCRNLDELLEEGQISETEHSTARRAYDFVSRVRNEAHFSTGRASDSLSLDLQPTVAANLGFAPKRGLQASEVLMREYYGRAQELLAVSEDLLERFWGGRTRRLSWPTKRLGPGEAFEIRDGKLHARDLGAASAEEPIWLLHVFESAQAASAPLSGELKLAVRARLKLVNRRFRASREAGEGLLRILRRPGRVAATLRLMHETGFLGRFLPEFGYITFLVQHDHYHKYTIDEHTLEAIGALDAIVGSDDPALEPFAEVLGELSDPASLYLGLLMHDIGKGRGGGHVKKGVEIAQRVCERLGCGGEMADDVVFLVRCHLLMSHISQRRDLSEERPIEDLLAEANSLSRLNQLLLLTYADISGVGPGVWNAWKGSLLWELYSKARARLERATDESAAGPWPDDVKRQALLELPPEIPASVIERHYALLPKRYLKAIDFPALKRDLRLVDGLASAPLVAEWRSSSEPGPDDLTVCTHDAPGLLARLAGTLTANGMNILALDLYTREDGIVLDTFTVARIGEFQAVGLKQRHEVQAGLRQAVEGGCDVEAGVAKWKARAGRRRKKRAPSRPHVRFDADASPGNTVVEMRADDEPGLVHRIANTLASAGVTITFAKVATEKSHALDIFYVTDADGLKLSARDMKDVEKALLAALTPEGGTK